MRNADWAMFTRRSSVPATPHPMFLVARTSPLGGAVSDRTAAEYEDELTMLAWARARLRASEGTDFRIPTSAVDRILDELGGLD
ncbi:hypothetical protein [Rhodococcus koreensis]